MIFLEKWYMKAIDFSGTCDIIIQSKSECFCFMLCTERKEQ